jgi:hypothetical protein
MKFVIIFGPPAVGKMSVGHELAKLTGFRLFHNHMTIELVLNFFEFEDPRFGNLVSLFRRRIFEEVAASELPGLIFTFVWAMDLEADKKFIDSSCEIFREQGAKVYFVELEAELEERLKRNEAPYRLSEKPSKRDVEHSRELLLAHDAKHKLNSRGDFFYTDNYLKIDNTHLPAHDTARRIIETFGFDAETCEAGGSI